jgi:hypothetical protein
MTPREKATLELYQSYRKIIEAEARIAARIGSAQTLIEEAKAWTKDSD